MHSVCTRSHTYWIEVKSNAARSATIKTCPWPLGVVEYCMQVVWSALRQKSRLPQITFALSLSLSLSLILLRQKCLSLWLTEDEICHRKDREGGESVVYRVSAPFQQALATFFSLISYEALTVRKYSIKIMVVLYRLQNRFFSCGEVFGCVSNPNHFMLNKTQASLLCVRAREMA